MQEAWLVSLCKLFSACHGGCAERVLESGSVNTVLCRALSAMLSDSSCPVLPMLLGECIAWEEWYTARNTRLKLYQG